MYLNRFALKLICNPHFSRSIKVASVIPFKFARIQHFSTNVKEAVNPIEKITESVKLEQIPKVVKRNEITCEELLSLIENNEILLIDVREKGDIEKYGLIPTAIHIPLNKLKSSFQLSKNEFKDGFGRDKPDFQNENIIFYGLKELKSSSACEIAYSLGYKKARSFPGGFKEWTEKEMKIFKIDDMQKSSA